MKYSRTWPNTGPQIQHYHRKTVIYTWKFALVLGVIILVGAILLLKVATYDYCPIYYQVTCLK